MNAVAFILAFAPAFFVGAISFAVLITRSKGINIFEVGSGNPGATNVTRVLGKKWGYTCFLLDALKGVAGVLIGRGAGISFELDPQFYGIIGLLGAILGHSFSPFLKFKGGKGVATTVGGLLTLLPPVTLIGAAAWIITFYSTRVVAIASIVLGVSLPISAFLLGRTPVEFWFCIIISLLIIIRHKSNINKLIAERKSR